MHMSFKIQAVTLLPALISIMVAVYLSIIALFTDDPTLKKLLVSIAVGLFFGAITMGLCWMAYWVIRRKKSVSSMYAKAVVRRGHVFTWLGLYR